MSDQIDVNQLSNALQQKVDLPSGKSQADIDYVIEWKAPTSSDPTWYRKYKSGWVEQGGTTEAIQVGTSQTVNLLVTMSNTNYHIDLTMWRVNTDDVQFVPANNYNSITTTSFILLNSRYTGSGTDTFCTKWEVKGFAATS